MGREITNSQLEARRIEVARVKAQFPTRVEDPHGTLPKMREMSERGLGFQVTSNHFCRDDFQRTLAVLMQGEMERKRVAIALGLHEFPTYEPFAKAAGIDVYPVTTQGTIDVFGPDAPPLGTGMEEFMAGAVEALSHGNLVIMAPQGGRRPRMSRSEGRILQTLMSDADDLGVEFGTVFSGIGMENGGSFDNRDYHQGELFVLKFSPVYTREMLLDALDGQTDGQKIRKVDAFWESQTRLLVPQKYLE